MAEYQYFSDFKLGNKYLSDFGNATIYNENQSNHTIGLSPEVTHTTDKMDLRDGEMYVASAYNPRVITIPVFFPEVIDLNELNSWLCKKGQQVFSWVDDDDKKEIDVIYNAGFNMDVYYGSKFYGKTTLSFIAHDPYWRITNERHMSILAPVINQVYNIKNKGNVDSHPVIRITPSGAQSKIRFKWNNEYMVVLQNVTRDIYIDCEEEEVYELEAGTGVKVIHLEKFFSTEYYDFPIIKHGQKNSIEFIEGSVVEANIELKTRII